MSELNINRKLFLEQEELVKFQEFIADSPSENAIIGNTSQWGILRTDFQSDTDFKVELGSNAGTIKIAKAENKALTAEGKRILQKAVDNVQITNDDSWYWVRISHEFSNQEPGTVNININGQVSGDGTKFISVLRGQSTKVPTKVRFVKQDGSPANNSAFYEVVDVIDNQNCILSSAVDFSAEADLKMVVLGTTPIGEALSASQEEGLYKYDSCNLELVPEVVTDTPPTNGYTEDLTFYIARVKNNGGTVTIEDKRTEYWEFNIVGLTDKLSVFNNLSDLNNPDAALSNLGMSTLGKNITKVNRSSTFDNYLFVNSDNTVSLLGPDEFFSARAASRLHTYFPYRGSNLSDLNDFIAARDNLGVYSKSEAVSSNVNLRKKVIEIGDWDMDTDPTKNINVSDITFSSVVNVSATILSDPDFIAGLTTKRNILEGGRIEFTYDSGLDEVRVQLYRDGGLDFDSINYNQTSYNRGWVIIDYIES